MSKESDKNLDNLTSVVDVLLKQCIKNMKDVEAIINILNSNKILNQTDISKQLEPNANLNVNANQELIDKINKIDSSIESNDIIINRRIELHKEMGSFVGKLDPPVISPLFKLNEKDRNDLYKQIYNKAIMYVKNVIGISDTEDSFHEQVSAEADRLLIVWMEINKFQ